MVFFRGWNILGLRKTYPIGPQSNLTTAILVFANTLEDERAVKAQEMGVSISVFDRYYHELTQRLRQKLAKTSFPVVWCTSAKQEGKDFSERLSHAINSVFQKGFEQLIVIGSDCPNLKVKDLDLAAAHLRDGRNVLGPDHRGGAYLIGIDRGSFDVVNFRKLPWQQPELFRALTQYLALPEILERKRDVNDDKDLHFIRSKVKGTFRLVVDAILSVRTGSWIVIQLFVKAFGYTSSNRNRPPPAWTGPSV